MAACPTCNRPLATGARTCVYCAHGNTYQRRQELKVPEGTTKRPGGFAWGRALVGLLVVGAVVAYFTQPGFRAAIDGIISSIKAKF
jgi:hypothetical protein